MSDAGPRDVEKMTRDPRAHEDAARFAARSAESAPGPGVTTFVDEKIVDAPIHEVFESILAVGRDRSGSYFAARTPSAMPGQVIRTFVPVVQGYEIRLEQSVARLAEYTPYRRLVIVQESPWESRTEIRLKAVGARTVVSSRTTVTEQTVDLVANMLEGAGDGEAEGGAADAPDAARPAGGAYAADAGEEPHRIALVTSMSGHSSLYGRSTVNCAKLAERRINAEGGILGRPVSVAVIDDASSPERGIEQLEALDRRHGVIAAVGVHSSAVAAAIDASGWAERKPYVFAPLSESTLSQRAVIAVGDTEQDQLELAIPHLFAAHGRAARWVLVGSDFSWPREVSRDARARIEAAGGSVAGEFYVDAEQPDVERLFEEVLAADPDIVVSSLVGWGLIEFEERIFAAGLRARISSLSLLMDDCGRELLGEAASGILAVGSYFPSLDSEENRRFVEEYGQMYGPLAPPISGLGESTYEALLLLARSANAAGSFSPGGIREHMCEVQSGGPRGTLQMRENGRVRARMHLAKATPSGWEILASS